MAKTATIEKISDPVSVKDEVVFKDAEKPTSIISHVLITKDQAAYMLGHYQWRIQRKLRFSNIQQFDELFLAGAWDNYSLIEISTTPDGIYLNDGQHRLASVMSTGDRYFRILDTPYSSMAEAKLHYAATDRNGRKRTTGEAMAAHIENLALRPDQVTKLSTALRFMNSAFNAKGAHGRANRKFQDYEFAFAVSEWKEYAEECFKMMSKAKKNIRTKLQSCPVLSLMLVTIRYNPSVAQKFWESTIADNGLKNGQPEKALITMLTAPDCKIETVGANIIARRVAAAFNNFCLGSEVSDLKAFVDKPIHIIGTPYNREVGHLYYEPQRGLLQANEL